MPTTSSPRIERRMGLLRFGHNEYATEDVAFRCDWKSFGKQEKRRKPAASPFSFSVSSVRLSRFNGGAYDETPRPETSCCCPFSFDFKQLRSPAAIFSSPETNRRSCRAPDRLQERCPHFERLDPHRRWQDSQCH